jgi:hypothetical protein
MRITLAFHIYTKLMTGVLRSGSEVARDVDACRPVHVLFSRHRPNAGQIESQRTHRL